MPRLNKQALDFLRSIETCTQGLEFMPEEQLDQLPPGVAAHIVELEDLISRLGEEGKRRPLRAQAHQTAGSPGSLKGKEDAEV